jgi:hypothetical protein
LRRIKILENYYHKIEISIEKLKIIIRIFEYGINFTIYVTLEEGLELINNYKKGLEKFLETLPEQSVQLGSEMIQTLTLNSKNQITNLEAIEKSLKRPAKN